MELRIAVKIMLLLKCVLSHKLNARLLSELKAVFENNVLIIVQQSAEPFFLREIKS